MEAAVAEVARLLGVDGSLLPATTGPVTLVADSDDGVLRGEVTIDRSTGIHNLRFDPARPDAPSEAVRAVERADQVIVGPGSLYTSVLAVAVVPPIRDALARTNAQVVYVANVATDRADARGFDLGAHVSALVDHGVVPDVVVAEHTSLDGEGAKFGGIPVVGASVAAADGWSHDADALAAVLGALCLDRSVGRDS